MGRPKKVVETTTNKAAVETTPEHLRHLGGDFTLAVPDHIDPETITNRDTYGLYRGDIVLKSAPETELQFATIDTSSGLERTKSLIHAKRDGWEPCLASDFYLSERAQIIFGVDASGQLTFGGTDKDTLVLYCRSRERYDAAMKYNRRFADDVSKSAEEKLAEMGAQMRFHGMTPFLAEVTEDSAGREIAKRQSDFLTKVF